MILISNLEFDLDGMVVPSNQPFEFVEDEDKVGWLLCESLRMQLTDPVFALIAFRHKDAPIPNLGEVQKMYREYCRCTDNDGYDLTPGEGLLGYEFQVMCWNSYGEAQEGEVLPVTINDTFGCGLDGFVTEKGYSVDSPAEALCHFIIK